jgi:hypothetical protein
LTERSKINDFQNTSDFNWKLIIYLLYISKNSEKIEKQHGAENLTCPNTKKQSLFLLQVK